MFTAPKRASRKLTMSLGLLLTIVALCSGCSKGARSLKLDKDLAHKSFEQFLTAWRDGKSSKELQDQSPQIICNDFEWNSGKKLISFKILEDEFSDGTNLTLAAEITIAVDGRPTPPQKVEYVVGTSPVITIFRP